MNVQINAAALDEFTKFMASMPGYNERARNAAMGSIGFNLKTEAKSAVSRNAFAWPDISNMTKMTRAFPPTYSTDGRRATRNQITAKNFLTMTSTAVKKAWGSLANLLVYSVEKTEGVLLFGFQSGTFGKKTIRTSIGTRSVANVIQENAVDLARKITEGFENVVTPKMQRYFAALGFVMRPGRVLKIPARPLIGPTFVMSKPMIATWFRNKFWERMHKYTGTNFT